MQVLSFLVPALVQLELARVFDLDLLQLYRRGLLYSVHVLIVHMIYLVRGAGCKDQHTFQDRYDKLSIETSLQECVHLGLLDNLVELNVSDALMPSTREGVADVFYLSEDNPITHSTDAHKEAEKSYDAQVPMRYVKSLTTVEMRVGIIVKHRLRVENERTFK